MSETCRTFATIDGTSIEVGRNKYEFFIRLPTMQSGYDSSWVNVDHFLKVAHFILVKTMYKGAKLAELYIARIMCLHGVSKKIVSDRGT
jgi:hypothetical protein